MSAVSSEASKEEASKIESAAMETEPSIVAATAAPKGTELARSGKLPVTVLSGMLGAGKSTLLKHILTNQDGLRIAVIVNDMGELNIDGEELRKAGIVRSVEAEMVEMQNGCICCTLRDDLLKEVSRLAQSKLYDYLVIESTGISEPIPVAQTFLFAAPGFPGLPSIARLDTMVTVVDAVSIWSDFQSGESLLDRKQQAGPDDKREISDLILDQLELANVVLVNKCDVVGEKAARDVEAFVRKTNPAAKVYLTTRSKVDLSLVLNTKLFNMDEAQQHQGWIKELTQGHHQPETEEYSISSFVFRAPRPFHSGRLMRLMSNWVKKIATPVPRKPAPKPAGAGGPVDLAGGAAGGGGGAGGASGPEGLADAPAPMAEGAGEAEAEEAEVEGTAGGMAPIESGEEKEEGKAEEGERAAVKGMEEGASAADESKAVSGEASKEGEGAGAKDVVPQEALAPPPAGLAEAMRNVLRSKGFVWMDTLKDFNVFWSQSGKMVQVRVGGPWWAELPASKWPTNPAHVAELRKGWHRRWGDRRCELVVIGREMDKAKVTEALTWCLCTEEELEGGFEAITAHDDLFMAAVNRVHLKMQIAMWSPF